MRQRFIFVVLIVSIISFVTSDGSFNFNNELNNFSQSGTFSAALLENLGDLEESQNTLLVNELFKLSQENKDVFWEQWKQLKTNEKHPFWSKMNENSQEIFLDLFSKDQGLDYFGFDSSVVFGTNGLLGNRQVFVNSEEIKKYNEENPQTKIIAVEYKNEDGKRKLIITKLDEGSAEIIVPEGKEGYRFDPKQHSFAKIGDDGRTDFKDPRSGIWNGKGKIMLDLTDDDVKIGLDFVRDDSGVVAKNDLAEFKTSKGDMYRGIEKELEDGGTLTREGHVILDEEGTPKEYSMISVENEKYSGEFGENINVFQSEENYNDLSQEEKDELGSYVIIDEETGLLKGDLNRDLPGGVVVGNFDEAITLIKERYPEFQGKVDQEILESCSEATGIAEKDLLSLMKSDSFVRHMSSLSKEVANSETFASFLDDISKQGVLKNNPLVGRPVPGPDDFLDIRLKKGFASTIKNVDLDAGSLSIESDNGRYVKIINDASPYNYFLNADFNKHDSFSGVNFNLINEELPEQKINIRSEGGRLIAQGLGGTELQNVGTDEISIKLSFTRTKRFGKNEVPLRLAGGPKGGRIIAELSSSTSEEAFQRLGELRSEYNQLRTQFKSDGYVSDEEREILLGLQKDSFEYYDIIARDKLAFELTARGDSDFNKEYYTTAKGFGNSLRNFDIHAQQDVHSLPGELRTAVINKVLSNEQYQDAFVQRGLIDQKSIEAGLTNMINEIASFSDRHVSNNIVFNADNVNRLYTLSSGGATMQIDPAYGPMISQIVPIVAGSGGVRNDNTIFLDPPMFKTRFQGYSLHKLHNSLSVGFLAQAARKVLRASGNTLEQKAINVYRPTVERMFEVDIQRLISNPKL